MDGVWENIDPEFKPPSGSAEHPSVRYSACAVQHQGALVVTHGYFYNHQIHRPAWQSNAWKFTFRTRKWQQACCQHLFNYDSFAACRPIALEPFL
eukprot:6197204-Pleurochrysis_carterae.AAC.2